MAPDFFSVYNFASVSSSSLDEELSSPHNSGKIICIFMWGHDCPNCDIAKKVLVDRRSEVDSLNIRWYQANIYEDFDLATRFGLFGIPVFLFFKDGKKLGKISPFPGFDPFYEAIMKLQMA